MDAEAVLLVDDDEGEVAEVDAGLEERVGADEEVDVAGGEAGEDRAPARGPSRGRSARRCARPAASASGAIVRACWRTSSSVGAMMAAWRAGFDDDRGGKQRHHRLAGADIALEKAEHALRPREIGLDLGERRALAAGQA